MKLKKQYVRIRASFPQIYKYQCGYLVSARSIRYNLNERKHFPTEKQATDYARSIQQNIVKYGKHPEIPKEKVQYAEGYEKLVSVLLPYNRTPEEAVKRLVDSIAQDVIKEAKPFIRDLVDSWKASKDADTELSKRTLTEIRSYARFIKRKWGDLKPDSIKRNDINLIFLKLKVSNNTRRKYLLYVRMFFSWVKYEGYIFQNPTDGIKFKADDFNGANYSPEKTKHLMRYVMQNAKEMVGYYALLTFAGLRPSEGARVQWQDYTIKTNELYVRKGKTMARHIILEPIAQEWMKFHRDNTPKDVPFVPQIGLEGKEKAVRQATLGNDWIQDGLRHGFGTYYKAKIKDIGKVADYMGNSPDIVKRHYARTVPNDECEAFWKLTPQIVIADEEKGNPTSTASPDNPDKSTDDIKNSDYVPSDPKQPIAQTGQEQGVLQTIVNQ